MTTVLQPMLTDWPTAAVRRLEQAPQVVRVTVASVRGSAPREPGACMLVDAHGIEGTIGGGNLEREAIAAAREQLEQPISASPIKVARLTLGRDLAQCCGGVVELWVERFTRADQPWLTAAADAARSGGASLVTSATHSAPVRTCLSERFPLTTLTVDEQGLPTLRERFDEAATPLWLYGAGHVGRAVVRALAELPFQVTLIDSRAELLAWDLPSNTRAVHAQNLAGQVKEAPTSARHLVMTHDHGLDYDLCEAILTRNEFAWLGLIGSASKAARFRSRLARAGISTERISRLVCPIGIGGLTSKLPAAIAASVTVQLLQELEHVAERALFQHDDCPGGDCKSCHARQGTVR